MGPGPKVIGDRFEVIDLAGAGGSATVYRAVDRESVKLVALKLLRGQLDDEALERFALEARVLAQLSHPGIVRYVSHGTIGGHVFLAMEWLEGLTLAQHLAQRRPLTVDESLALVARVAEALGVAHTQGIVHRDIKPGNIFLVDGDPRRPKLLDFGVARLRFRITELTQAGVVLGTPGFMAPEQARAERVLDPRADVFSLGCVLYRCLTGRNPFAGEDVVAVLAKVLLADARPVRELVPEVPAAVADLVAQMLAKRPVDRPADANAVAVALDTLGRARPAEALLAEPASISGDERRIMCILLSRASGDPPGAASGDHDALRAAVAAHGGHLDVLANGSLLVTLEGAATPTDHAARGARCALAMRAVAPWLPVVLVAGEGEIKGRVAIGPVIDRGAALLADAGATQDVRVDGIVAALLGARFETREDGGVLSLVAERDAAPAARTFLGRPSPCLGRERDLALLGGIWDECVEESVARIVLVTGPAGVGKSRVLDELLRQLAARGRPLEVWTGHGDPMSARSPFGMIADAIRNATGIQRGEPVATRQLKLYTRVQRAVPAEEASRVAVFLAEIVGTPFPADASVELLAARDDAQLMGDQMRRAWEDWLHAEAAKRPILLVLEDLHWGDVTSIQFVDAAARYLANRPFLVLALARPDVYEAFPKIWTDRSLTELRLGRLPSKAAARLVRGALGDEARAETVDAIVARADGNPLFLEELVRATVEGKGDELPSTVLAMVQARLGALSVDARRFLRAASVFGKAFSSHGVAALVGADEGGVSIHDCLAELVAKDVVKRPPEAQLEGELSFSHALIHEAAYSMLTEADRALGHGLAAEWL
ncbi:MAG TPA: protein kinase, partial [Minicystis sp.]|nr:protein kinase [Minicystis sp.]